jgi:hypothetical protein
MFHVDSVEGMPNLIAVNTIAENLARNLMERIIDKENKCVLLTKFLRVLGFSTEGDIRRSICRCYLRPTMPLLSNPEALKELLGEEDQSLLNLFKLIANDLVYPENPRKRAKTMKQEKAPTVNDWAHLWNQFVKDTFMDVRLKYKQQHVTIQKVPNVNFEYLLDPLMMQLVQAHLCSGSHVDKTALKDTVTECRLNYKQSKATEEILHPRLMQLLQARLCVVDDTPLLDEVYASSFVQRKLDTLRRAVSASAFKKEGKVKDRVLRIPNTGELYYNDYDKRLRDDGFAGDYCAKLLSGAEPWAETSALTSGALTNPACVDQDREMGDVSTARKPSVPLPCKPKTPRFIWANEAYTRQLCEALVYSL